MTVSCYHNFCSMCVRKYLLYKQQCPTCFGPLHDPDLKPNRGLADAMEIISRLVPKLMALMKEVKPGFKLPIKSPISKPQKVVKKEAANVPATPPQLNVKIVKTNSPQIDLDAPTPSTSSSVIEFPDRIGPGPSELGKRVPCPVCFVSILEKNVNNHLDKCLAEQNGEVSKPEPTFVNNMRPLKQPIYHLLKDNDIKKRLKDHGLEPKGDRKILTSRLKSFIALWNGQCDLVKPMTKLEMIMKLKKEERNLQQVPVIRTPSVLNFDSKTDPKVIESKQKEYVEKNKDHFSMLIAKVKTNNSTKTLKKPTIETVENEENAENDITIRNPYYPSNITADISEMKLTPKRDSKLLDSTLDTSKPIPNINLTPKRKFVDSSEDSDSNDENSLSSQQAQQPSQQISKKPRQLFDAPKPMYSKVLCPICNDSIAENLIQSHAERCLDKPEPRSSRVGVEKKKIKIVKKKTEKQQSDNDDDQDDFDPDLFNATPDIIIGEDENVDVICSTPIAAKESRRRITRKCAKDTTELEQGDNSPTL